MPELRRKNDKLQIILRKWKDYQKEKENYTTFVQNNKNKDVDVTAYKVGCIGEKRWNR